jgi:hypothetical protein
MLELLWQSENLHITTNANQLVVVPTNANKCNQSAIVHC